MSTPKTKHVATSKTVQANIIVTAIISLVPGAREFFVDKPEALAVIYMIMNLILRKVTHSGIHFIKPAQ